jgi:hypothetical protein
LCYEATHIEPEEGAMVEKIRVLLR